MLKFSQRTALLNPTWKDIIHPPYIVEIDPAYRDPGSPEYRKLIERALNEWRFDGSPIRTTSAHLDIDDNVPLLRHVAHNDVVA